MKPATGAILGSGTPLLRLWDGRAYRGAFPKTQGFGRKSRRSKGPKTPRPPLEDRASDMFDRDHAGNGLDGPGHLGRDLEAAGQFDLDLTAFAIQQQDQ